MAKAKKGTPNIAPIEVPVNEGANVVPVTPDIVTMPENDTPIDVLHVKLGIDQIGVDIDGAVSEKLYFELKVIQGKEPLNIAQIAARLGRQVWAGVKHLKTKRKGFNVSFYIDNKLTLDYSLKSGGNIRFTNPTNTIFGILGLLAVQFDDTNAMGYITGEFENSDEINTLCRQLGMPSAKLPFEYLEQALDIKRKSVGRKLSEKKKELLAHMN